MEGRQRIQEGTTGWIRGLSEDLRLWRSARGDAQLASGTRRTISRTGRVNTESWAWVRHLFVYDAETPRSRHIRDSRPAAAAFGALAGAAADTLADCTGHSCPVAVACVVAAWLVDVVEPARSHVGWTLLKKRPCNDARIIVREACATKRSRTLRRTLRDQDMLASGYCDVGSGPPPILTWIRYCAIWIWSVVPVTVTSLIGTATRRSAEAKPRRGDSLPGTD